MFRLNAEVPRPLRDRAERVSKRLRMAVAQIVREGLDERVSFYEKKIAAEDEQELRAREERRAGRRTLRSLGERPLAPAATSELAPEPLAPVAFEAAPGADALEALYRHHAARILEVMDKDAAEKRLRVMEAIAAVKREQPLRYPPDGVILSHLETFIVELRAAAAPAPPLTPPAPSELPMTPTERIFDELVGRTLNATVPTFGDVDPAKE